MKPKQHHGGEEIKDLASEDANAILTTGPGEAEGAGVDDDLEGGTTRAASMSDGDTRRATSPEARGGGSDAAAARPGGQWNTGPAGSEAGGIGKSSIEPGPQGPGGGDRPGGGPGTGGGGSIEGAGYDNTGRLVGHDSPAGEDAETDVGGDGQGDDLANHLGGEEGRGAGMSGSGSVSGDMSAGRSEEVGRGAPAGGAGGDPGSPGGMGGVNATIAGIGRPPGGVSPVQADEKESANDR